MSTNRSVGRTFGRLWAARDRFSQFFISNRFRRLPNHRRGSRMVLQESIMRPRCQERVGRLGDDETSLHRLAFPAVSCVLSTSRLSRLPRGYALHRTKRCKRLALLYAEKRRRMKEKRGKKTFVKDDEERREDRSDQTSERNEDSRVTQTSPFLDACASCGRREALAAGRTPGRHLRSCCSCAFRGRKMSAPLAVSGFWPRQP